MLAAEQREPVDDLRAAGGSRGGGRRRDRRRGRAIVLEGWPLVTVATAGTLVGTLLGERVLRRIPERVFRTVVSLLILALGVAVLAGVGPT